MYSPAPAQSKLFFENAKLTVLLNSAGKDVIVTLRGVIDEDCCFNKLAEQLKTDLPSKQNLCFNLTGVERINSCGIRDWLHMMRTIQPVIPVRFEEVSEVIIEQANMIAGFFGNETKLPGSPVISFHAPYECKTCHTSSRVLIAPAEVDLTGGAQIAPKRNCAQCNGPLEFDGIEEEYFFFLKRLGG